MSLGILPGPKLELVQALWWPWVKSARSRRYGIQPIPPSDRAIFSVGNFFHIGPQIQSAAELAIEIGIEVIQASIGDRSEAWFAAAPVPMWQQITTWLSAQTFHSGSQ